jgi:DNA-binding response OmpR family regulator
MSSFGGLLDELGRCRTELTRAAEHLMVLEKLIQRLQDPSASSEFCPVIVEREAHRIRAGHRVLRLSRRQEFEVLALLVERRDGVVSAEQIIDAVWDDDRSFGITPKRVNHLICRIRAKLHDEGLDDCIAIKTLRGVGYSCEAP